jgi:hypothetical protein
MALHCFCFSLFAFHRVRMLDILHPTSYHHHHSMSSYNNMREASVDDHEFDDFDNNYVTSSAAVTNAAIMHPNGRQTDRDYHIHNTNTNLSLTSPASSIGWSSSGDIRHARSSSSSPMSPPLTSSLLPPALASSSVGPSSAALRQQIYHQHQQQHSGSSSGNAGGSSLADPQQQSSMEADWPRGARVRSADHCIGAKQGNAGTIDSVRWEGHRWRVMVIWDGYETPVVCSPRSLAIISRPSTHAPELTTSTPTHANANANANAPIPQSGGLLSPSSFTSLTTPNHTRSPSSSINQNATIGSLSLSSLSISSSAASGGRSRSPSISSTTSSMSMNSNGMEVTDLNRVASVAQVGVTVVHRKPNREQFMNMTGVVASVLPPRPNRGRDVRVVVNWSDGQRRLSSANALHVIEAAIEGLPPSSSVVPPLALSSRSLSSSSLSSLPNGSAIGSAVNLGRESPPLLTSQVPTFVRRPVSSTPSSPSRGASSSLTPSVSPKRNNQVMGSGMMSGGQSTVTAFSLLKNQLRAIGWVEGARVAHIRRSKFPEGRIRTINPTSATDSTPRVQVFWEDGNQKVEACKFYPIQELQLLSPSTPANVTPSSTYEHNTSGSSTRIRASSGPSLSSSNRSGDHQAQVYHEGAHYYHHQHQNNIGDTESNVSPTPPPSSTPSSPLLAQSPSPMHSTGYRAKAHQSPPQSYQSMQFSNNNGSQSHSHTRVSWPVPPSINTGSPIPSSSHRSAYHHHGGGHGYQSHEGYQNRSSSASSTSSSSQYGHEDGHTRDHVQGSLAITTHTPSTPAAVAPFANIRPRSPQSPSLLPPAILSMGPASTPFTASMSISQSIPSSISAVSSIGGLSIERFLHENALSEHAQVLQNNVCTIFSLFIRSPGSPCHMNCSNDL